MSTPNPDSIADLLSSKYISQYCQIALLTVLAYDILITMEAEVKYFWSNPRNFISVIYFANRYTGLFGAICGVAFVGIQNFLSPISKGILQGSFSKWSELLADWATFILIEYVLLMRVLALYSRGRTTTLCLRALFALETIYTLALLVYVVVYEKVGVLHLSDGLSLCGGVGDNKIIPKTYAAAWVPPMVYDLILMSLSLYKAVQFWRESPGSTAVDLVKVVIQDQAMYFVLLIVNTSAQILSEVLKSSMLTDFLSVLGNPLILCVLGSRLVVNMKEAGEKGENGGSNGSIATVSDIQFS